MKKINSDCRWRSWKSYVKFPKILKPLPWSFDESYVSLQPSVPSGISIQYSSKRCSNAYRHNLLFYVVCFFFLNYSIFRTAWHKLCTLHTVRFSQDLISCSMMTLKVFFWTPSQNGWQVHNAHKKMLWNQRSRLQPFWLPWRAMGIN